MTSEYDELLARLDRLANHYGSPFRVESDAAAAIRALTAQVVERYAVIALHRKITMWFDPSWDDHSYSSYAEYVDSCEKDDRVLRLDEMATFEVCAECQRIEDRFVEPGGLDGYLNCLWPCRTAVSLGNETSPLEVDESAQSIVIKVSAWRDRHYQILMNTGHDLAKAAIDLSAILDKAPRDALAARDAVRDKTVRATAVRDAAEWLDESGGYGHVSGNPFDESDNGQDIPTWLRARADQEEQ